MICLTYRSADEFGVEMASEKEKPTGRVRKFNLADRQFNGQPQKLVKLKLTYMRIILFNSGSELQV